MRFLLAVRLAFFPQGPAVSSTPKQPDEPKVPCFPDA